jgi:DNA-binding MarR family transcriptional regulator
MQEAVTAIRQWMEASTLRSMREWRRYVRSAGLSTAQVIILMRLFYGGRCEVHDIGRHLDVTSAAASQLVDRLVNAGLAERSEDPEDRRVRTVTLSAKGRRLIEEGIEERYRWVEDLAAALSEEERAALLRALPPLIAAGRKLSTDAIGEPRERLPVQGG